MSSGSTIAGIILSGGASRRMGTPKALLIYDGETFLDRTIRIFEQVCDPVIVVLGHGGAQIRAGIARPSRAIFVTNPDPERGMLSSLQCALYAVPEDAAAVMFTPVDHPGLQRSTLELLARQFRADRAPVTVPTHGGKHGHPVCIERSLITELLLLEPAAQASDVIHRYRGQTVYVPVPDASVTHDVDDPETYRAMVTPR